MSHVPDAYLLTLQSTVRLGERAMAKLLGQLPNLVELPEDVYHSARAYRFVHAELEEMPPVVLCIEPRGTDEEPDRYCGNICGQAAEFTVWGAYGANRWYPVCRRHARRWGTGYAIGRPDELVAFDPDLRTN